MKERTAWGLIGFAVGAVSAWCARSGFQRKFAERPPIIVRGGSISFETDCGWTEGSSAWLQKFSGPAVNKFVVKITDGSTVSKELKGTEIKFSHGPSFKVTLDDGEPQVGPRGQLKKVAGAKDRRVKHAGGDCKLGKVKVDSEEYEFQDGEEAFIDYE